MTLFPALATHILRFVVRWWYGVILLAVATAALCARPATELYRHIDTDMANLLPDHYPSVAALKRIRAKFRAGAGLIIVLEGETPEKGRAATLQLAETLRSDPRFTEVEYEKPGYEFFDRHKLLYLEQKDLETIRDRIQRKIQREKLGSLYVDLETTDDDGEEFQFRDLEKKYRSKYASGTTSRFYTSDDERVYSLYAKPADRDERLDRLADFYRLARAKTEEFRAAWPDQSLQMYFTGPVRTRVEEYRGLIQDLVRAGIISGLGVLLVLFLYFRRVVATLLLAIPLVMGILASLAVASFFITDLNLITSFLFAILGGLGVEIGIHILSRYLEERRAGRTMEAALEAVLTRTSVSAFTSVASVAATFLILLINDFKGFSEFGLIAGVGLLINFLCYTLVFPSLLVAAERFHLLALHRKVGMESFRRHSQGTFPHARIVVLAAFLITFVAALLLSRVPFEWRFSHLKASIPEAALAKQKQRLTSSSVNNPAAVIIQSQAEAMALEHAIEQKMQQPDTTISGFKSAFDLVPKDQAAKLAVVKEMETLLADPTLVLVEEEQRPNLERFREALRDTTLVTEEEIPERLRQLFWGRPSTDLERSAVVYINPLPTMEMDDGQNAIRFQREVGSMATPLGVFHPSNDAIVFADVLQTMMRDGKRAVFLAFLCVIIIVWWDVRRFRETALIVAPIVFGVIVMGGIMVLFGIKLNFYNIVVIPTAVGTSIDNAVHLFHRFRENEDNLTGALFSTGGAALLSSLTNICGFLGLAFVDHPGLRSIGLLAIAGLSACLITTLVFFPAALQIFGRRKGR